MSVPPPPLPAAARWDPLRTYQFRVGMLPLAPDTGGAHTFLGAPRGAAAPRGTVVAGADSYVAGVRRVSGLTLTVSASETWEGGNALHRYANPDRATWEPITLEQGLAVNDTLERWAGAVTRFLATGSVAEQEPVKRNILIDVWDTGQHGPAAATAGRTYRMRRYVVVNAWISKFHAIPQLDAMTDEVGLLSVELTHDGWYADQPSGATAPASPTQPTPSTQPTLSA